jgi:hypothetical protein
MQTKNILQAPSRFNIKILDHFSPFQLPFSKYSPLLYKQQIQVTPDMFPDKPATRSQLYLHFNPLIHKAWVGGIPIGKVVENTESQLYRFDCKQYRSKYYLLQYHPALHKTFPWKNFETKQDAFEGALQTQRDFNDKYKAWRNQYRVSYCELTDRFFLQVRVNHFFPEAVFECDIEDIDLIFSKEWYLKEHKLTDKYGETKYKYDIVSGSFIYSNGIRKFKKEIYMTRLLSEERAIKYHDTNVFNNRRNNLVKL